MARRRSSACVALISIRFMMRSFSVQRGFGAENACARKACLHNRLWIPVNLKAHVAGADA
jgi:hypothetical protein